MNHISQYLPKTHHCIAATAIGLVSFATGSSPVTAIAIAALSQLPFVLGINRKAISLVNLTIKKAIDNPLSQYNKPIRFTIASATLLGISACSIYGGGLLGSALFGTPSISLIQTCLGGACNLALQIDSEIGYKTVLTVNQQINSFIKTLTG